MTETAERARAEAHAQLESIREMVAAYRASRENTHDGNAALRDIHEDPLSLSVRSDWHTPGEQFDAAEYQILLSWGGPASRITGLLDDGDPATATLEYQDWFTPWVGYPITREDEETLLEYARCFHFGA